MTLNMSPEVVDVSNWKDYNLHESLDVKIQELEAEYKGKKSFGILFKECCLWLDIYIVTNKCFNFLVMKMYCY